MDCDKLTLENYEGADRVHLIAIFHDGGAEDVAACVLIAEDEMCQHGVFCSFVPSLHGALERSHEHVEPAFSTVIVLAKRGAELFQHHARDIFIPEVL